MESLKIQRKLSNPRLSTHTFAAIALSKSHSKWWFYMYMASTYLQSFIRSLYRGGRSHTRELIHDVHKQRFGIKFACSYDYLKVNLKFNRYASFTPGIPGE